MNDNLSACVAGQIIENMTSTDEGRPDPFSKSVNHYGTLFVFGMGFVMLLAKQQLTVALLLLALFVTLPLLYIFILFNLSKCINKEEVRESGFNMNKLMLFKNSANRTVRSFVEYAVMDANLLLCIIILIVVSIF